MKRQHATSTFLFITSLFYAVPALLAEEKNNPSAAAPAAPASNEVADLEAAATTAMDSDNSDRAIELLRQAAALTDPKRNEDEWARVQKNWLGRLMDLGKFDEFEAVAKQYILAGEKAFGANHPATVRLQAGLDQTMPMLRKFKEEEEPIRTQLATRERELGPKHPDTLASRGRLAELLAVLGKRAEAEALYTEVLKVLEQEFGPEHKDTLKYHALFALVNIKWEKWAKAKEEGQRAFAGYQKTLGDEHQKTKDAKRLIEIINKNIAKKKPKNENG